MDEAIVHCTRGIGIWDWVSNDTGEPDVVMACAGDIPTLETLAAVDLIRQHLPELKVRVVNVVDLMKLQPDSEHPHGLSDAEFDALFTTSRPVVFAYHGYPWLIHRLTYRRRNHGNLHVRGYKEEGTVTTPFDMLMRNDMDRFHLVVDVIDRVPGLAAQAGEVRRRMVERREAVRAALPRVPAVACFDTAFHADLPAAASTYALPAAWRARWDLRRYGFHGLSHAYASRRAAELLERPVAGLRVVVAHLGAGASL